MRTPTSEYITLIEVLELVRLFEKLAAAVSCRSR